VARLDLLYMQVRQVLIITLIVVAQVVALAV
jgi:hypothetical protein